MAAAGTKIFTDSLICQTTFAFSKKGRKNNKSPTEKGRASELGLPTPKGASVAKVGAKIVNKSECVKRLGELFDYIDQKKPGLL